MCTYLQSVRQVSACPPPAHPLSLLCVQTSWLLGLAGIDLAAPKEHEDPNLACNNIISAVKRLGRVLVVGQGAGGRWGKGRGRPGEGARRLVGAELQ